jgi:hypothetical protein
MKAIVFLCVLFGWLLFVTSHNSTVGTPVKKTTHTAFPLRFRCRPPLLLLRSRRCHGFFFDFFKLRPSLTMSGAFRWHQLSWLGPSHASAHAWSSTLLFITPSSIDSADWLGTCSDFVEAVVSPVEVLLLPPGSDLQMHGCLVRLLLVICCCLVSSAIV